MKTDRFRCENNKKKNNELYSLPLDGQCKREPDGRGVEHRRYDFVHGVPRVTRLDRRQRFVMVAQRVHVEQPRSRKKQREHVGQGHGHEHHVGGRAHVSFGQDDYDERVGHYGDQQQKRHDEPVQWPGVLHRHLVGDVQVAAFIDQFRPVVVRRPFHKDRFVRIVEGRWYPFRVVHGHVRTEECRPTAPTIAAVFARSPPKWK